MTADNRFKMVGWYDPQQLIRTAGQVIISTIFGRHADHRLIEALTPASDQIFDRSYDEQGQPRSEIMAAVFCQYHRAGNCAGRSPDNRSGTH